MGIGSPLGFEKVFVMTLHRLVAPRSEGDMFL